MKTRSLLLSLLFPPAALLAVEPPKLVPRPIPGMPSFKPVEAAAPTVIPLTPTSQEAPLLITNPDRARVLYIHRRSTLPAELTRNIPTSPAAPSASSSMLNVRQGSVKIIPKSQVAQIIMPKP